MDWRHERQSFIFWLSWKSEITVVAGSVSSEAAPLGVGGHFLPASSHGLPLCRQGPVSPSREGTSCTGLGSTLMNSFELNCLCKDCLQIRLHSEVLGIKISTWILEGETQFRPSWSSVGGWGPFSGLNFISSSVNTGVGRSIAGNLVCLL